MNRPALSLLLLLVIVAVLAQGCSGAPALEEARPAPVAEGIGQIGDQIISEEDLEVAVAPSLEQLEERRNSLMPQLTPEQVEGAMQIFEHQAGDVRGNVLVRMASDMLINQEAERLGVDLATLLADEVEGKVKPVVEQDLLDYYEENKHTLSMPATFEQMREPIAKRLAKDRVKDRRRAYILELKEQTTFRLDLERPRFDVVNPPGVPQLGPDDAPVTVVEFADYECPACQQMFPLVKRLMRDFDGKVRLQFRDFPLDIHPSAIPAATAARCADEQGKFWEYHDALFSDPDDLSDMALFQRADDQKLDRAKFESCFSSGRHRDPILKSFSDGFALGVKSTPTLFVNGRILVRTNYDRLKQVVHEELLLASGS